MTSHQGHAAAADPGAGPFGGFAPAAAAAVNQLDRQLSGMDLWLVTCVAQDRQLVIARAGGWADLAPAGTEFSWQASFCIRMLAGAPQVAANVSELPVYRKAAIGPLAKVRAYLGVPLMIGDNELFGTLCAVAGAPRPESLADSMPTVSLLARMLSTILAGERATRDRSSEAAQAYGLAERDPVTGLRNRRGFQVMLNLEEGRARRFGTRSSVLVLHVDDLETVTERLSRLAGQAVLRRCAALLTEVAGLGDVPARVEGGEFAVLAVQTDPVGARALAVRLRRRLRTAQLRASVGVATRRVGEDLTQTWQRANQASRVDQRRHLHTEPIPPREHPS